MTSRRQKSFRKPVLAAGGIVTAAGRSPLIAVVQRRKDDGWVLPKGKLKPRESAIAAARREAIEETGHRVTVHEFLGAVSYESGGKPKIVKFWRMISTGEAQAKPMKDIKAVEWLPLDAAIARLSQPLERVFLTHMGRRAIGQARLAARLAQPAAKSRPAITELRERHKQRAAAKLRLKNRAAKAVLTAQATGVAGPELSTPPMQSAAPPNFLRRLFQRSQSAMFGGSAESASSGG